MMASSSAMTTRVGTAASSGWGATIQAPVPSRRSGVTTAPDVWGCGRRSALAPRSAGGADQPVEQLVLLGLELGDGRDDLRPTAGHGRGVALRLDRLAVGQR